MTDQQTRRPGRPRFYDANLRSVQVWLPPDILAWVREQGNVSSVVRETVMAKAELSRAVTQAKQQANQTGRPVAICRHQGQLTIRAYTDMPDRVSEIHIVYPARQGQNQEE